MTDISASPAPKTTGETLIEVSNVSIDYQMAEDRVGTFKEFMLQALRRQRTLRKFKAVNGVSFTVRRGETLALIGPNGAGKTTLMKVVARVLPPSDGRVIVRGNLAPMIALGAGFNPEVSAYDNIILFGTLLGRDAEHMRERVPVIAEWAGLSEFIQTPVRNYSSGMTARLGFAVAADVDPDVMVVDEVLSVGDQVFQKKSFERMQELMSGGTAVLLVSHALDQVEKMADRVIWLDHGSIVKQGPPDEVIAAYKASVE